MSVEDLYKELVEEFDIGPEPVTEVLPTGSLFLDRALGIGGYPSGRVIEIFGNEGAGKTTIGLHAMAQAKKKKWNPALIDMECSLDEAYAKAIGCGKRNVDFLHMVPNYGEQAVEMVKTMLDREVRLILVDSVSSMVPKAEMEGETGEAFMGAQARMMGQAMRTLTTRIHDAGAIVIFINQVRSKIGVFFGSPETTSGGRALPFFASQRIRVRSGKDIGQDGKLMMIRVVKNKVGPPLKECEIPLIYGKGVDAALEMFGELQESGRITKKSSFYYFDGDKLGNGRLQAAEAIRANMREYRRIINEDQKATST